MWQPSSRWKGVFPAALSARSSTRRYARSGDQRITARPDFIGIARQHDFHCELMRIVNWGTFDDEEFARKNIFYLGHPEHAEFHRVMRFAGGLREALPRQPPRVCPPRVGGPVPYAPLAGHDPGQAGPPAEVLGSAVFT